jgi:hypothetical protein
MSLGRHAVLQSTKNYFINSNIIFEGLHNHTFQDPALRNVSVVRTSQIRMTAMLILLMAVN